jgi:hypothetical protein
MLSNVNAGDFAVSLDEIEKPIWALINIERFVQVNAFTSFEFFSIEQNARQTSRS